MKLKVLLWNLQDLFLFMDKYQGEDLSTLSEPKWQLLTTSFKTNKELEKIRAMADLIHKVKPDICLFTEVGGEESLVNFNHYFLKEQFKHFHTPSNSDRGIDLGILFHPKLEKFSQFKFHKHKVFARGVMQYQINLTAEKKFIFLLTHLKSKLNKANDFEGRSQRQKEVNKLIDIYQKVSDKGKVPTAICGDLNGIIFDQDSDFELQQFATKIGLLDVFEHLNKSHFDRSTYVYYNNERQYLMQLDYFLIDGNWKHILGPDSQVLDFDGTTRTTMVGNLAQKQRCPSDHYPVLINLNLS